MKKVALVFVIAVLLPSLVLAWLAVRSLRDQQFLLERQQALLCQRVTDALAQRIADYLAQQQQDFSAQVEMIVADKDARAVANQFDGTIRQRWPLAEVGFCVTRAGKILSPSVNTRSEAKTFYEDNGGFLGNRESAEVYGSVNTLANNSADDTSSSVGGSGQRGYGFNSFGGSQKQVSQSLSMANSANAPAKETMEFASAARKMGENRSQLPQTVAAPAASGASEPPSPNYNNYKAQARKVTPQSGSYQQFKDAVEAKQEVLSRVIPAEGEFSQLIGNGTDGMLARFLQNKLKLMFWHRLNRDPDLIFGAQVNLNFLVNHLRPLVLPDETLREEISVMLLDDNAKPVASSENPTPPNFRYDLKHPFVATEVGEALPHWEVAAYLFDPARLTQAAQTTKLALGLLIAVLVLAIGVGSWLIVRNLSSELKLARQKTDFVSNVSHELKTPLTSIRMFSELLAEGRVTDATKQRSYLNIISAEAARLTRLINNVLDFSRMENGDKKYNFQPCDLTEVVRATAETFRPHLEANGFKFAGELPTTTIAVRGDSDALSQIIVNLLSNAEKYSNGKKEIAVQLAQKQSPLPYAEIQVLDRGSGVPRGCEEKVFEKFYRAHDSLSSGVQGSGLGLTIARQIARAHGGDVVYEPRAGGGSCFVLRLPISTTDGHGRTQISCSERRS